MKADSNIGYSTIQYPLGRQMRIRDYIGRVVYYARRHSPLATSKRLLLSLERLRTGRRFVLFYCDLRTFRPDVLGATAPGKIECRTVDGALDMQDLSRIVNVGYPALVRRQLSERFAQGAAVWLFKLDDKLAAYGWTLTGSTIEPHFFPLGSKDVHLFDFFVFPEYRGRRLNVSLVLHILSTLASQGKARAFIEAAEWNASQLRSLGRMPFEKLGYARKYRCFGKTVVVWSAIQRKPGS